MTKFHFSITGRRKTPSLHLEDGRPLSKAHKILGSTPISIDNPVYLERASSSAIDVTLSGRAKQLADDALSEDNVRLAMSEGEWEGDPDFTPAHQHSIITREVYSEGRLKKSQSSTAIRPQKRQHPITKYSSTLALPDPHPFGMSHVEDLDVAHDVPKTKKKPAGLDLSNLVPGCQASRHSYHCGPDSAASGTFTTSSRAASSVVPPPCQHSSRLGSSLKRRTKESLRSLLSDASGSTSSGGNQREANSDSGLSTLYDHYEQMSLLQVIKQGQASEDGAQSQVDHLVDSSHDQSEWKEPQVEVEDLDWLHKPFRETAQTFPPGSHKSSSRGHEGKRASSKNGRVSKHPKKPKKGKEDDNFHDKSVLLLSDSDSDSNANMTLHNRTYEPASLPTKVLPRSSRSKDTLRVSSQTRPSSEPHDRKPPRRRTTDPYRTTSRPEDEQSPAHPRLPYNPRYPPARETLSSRDSEMSVMTCQFGFGVGPQEPPAMTSLPIRRPSQEEMETEAARIRAADNVVHVLPRESVPRSPDQLTPPLSPSSVDFYMRSARPSVDMADPPNRIMAVTREEKMLISALRKKNQAMRENAKLEAEAKLSNEGHGPQGYDPSSSRFATGQSPTYDPGFPTPPILNLKPSQYTEKTAVPNSQVPLKLSLDNALSQGDYSGYRKGSFLRKESDAASWRDGHGGSAVYQDVLVYLDQSRVTPGMCDAMENDDRLDGRSGLAPHFNPVSWSHDEDAISPTTREEILPRKRFHPGRIQTENIPPASHRLATLSEHDLGEASRPESPISPESFPSVPANRIRSHNRARLSAVGFKSPGASVQNEPIWGDDD